MTANQIGKLWTIISALLLYYALDTWIVTQGGNEIFGAKLVLSKRIPAAMMAIPICSVLLAVTSMIGRVYARRAGDATWSERVPVVAFEQIDTDATDAKVYQGILFALFSVLPMIALIHFWRLFSNAWVVTTSNPPRLIGSIWDWSGLTSWNDPARICDTPAFTCTDNSSILPGLEPTIFAVMTSIAVVTVIAHWIAVFRRYRV